MVNSPPVSLEGGNAREFVDGPSGLIFCRLAFAVYVSRSGESLPEMEMFNFHVVLRAGPEGEGDSPPEMEMFNFHFALWAAPVQGLIYALTPSTGPQRVPRWAHGSRLPVGYIGPHNWGGTLWGMAPLHQ